MNLAKIGLLLSLIIGSYYLFIWKDLFPDASGDHCLFFVITVYT